MMMKTMMVVESVVVVIHALEVALEVALVIAMAVVEVATGLHVHICRMIMSKRRVVFVVTQDCQLQCNYCYLVGKNKESKMTWEIAREIVDFLMSLPIVEDEAIFDFIGGEPLLEIELITKISDYLVERMKEINHPWINKYSFRFTTNGLAYSSSKVQEYINKHKDQLSIQISIDGTKKKHDLNRKFSNGNGSYDKILPNVKLWIEQFGERANSFTVISHNDLPYLAESLIHNIELGIKNVAANLVVEDVWKEGDDLIYEEELMKVADYLIEKRLWNIVTVSSFAEELGTPNIDEHIYPCGNPMYVFDTNGMIYSCVRFVGFSLRSKVPRVIGTIHGGIDYNKIRPFLSFDSKSFYPSKCLNCEIATGCRWCPAENYDSSDTGTIFQRTMTVCDLHKANVRVKNYYWNRIRFIEANER